MTAEQMEAAVAEEFAAVRSEIEVLRREIRMVRFSVNDLSTYSSSLLLRVDNHDNLLSDEAYELAALKQRIDRLENRLT